MNYEALLQLYRSRSVFRKLLGTIAAEGLDENRTIVEELVDGETTRRVAVNLLRDLDAMGCGEFKVGRKGHPSRFEWSVDPRTLGQRLANGSTADDDGDREAEVEVAGEPDEDTVELEASELDDEASEPIQTTLGARLGLDDEPQPHGYGYYNGSGRHRASAQPKRSTVAATDVITHQYVLRRDMRVSLELPSDLSRREAEVLAAWVRELSFDR